jgi:hypothetical protein
MNSIPPETQPIASNAPRLPINRILDLTSGVTMIVSDLHGDKDAFARHVGRFLQLHSRKRVQRIVFLGDLIHSDGPESDDASLQIVTDIMRMRATLGSDAVVALLGNHELPHLYGVILRRGQFEYTPRFEKSLVSSGRRAEILAFFEQMPFYVRTASGVAFTHAGPDGTAIAQFEELRTFDHAAIRSEYGYALALNPKPDQLRKLYGEAMGMDYEVLARYYLAVEGQGDPRYDDLLRAFMISEHSREFEVLWGALFTRCEKELSPQLYARILAKFLETLSVGAPAPQRFLVTGHLDVDGGHEWVTPTHLRIASAKHAHPRESGEYLLFDVGTPIESAEALTDKLGGVYKA